MSYQIIVEEIHKELQTNNDHILHNGDLSDIGNHIGIVIGRYIEDKPGFELLDFMAGLQHGISLTDGSHPRLNP